MPSQTAAATILYSVILKILHTHRFSRASSQACVVLASLISRYLILLSSVCGSCAEFSGRSRVSIWDVLSSLGDLGVSLEELDGYCVSEGKEIHSQVKTVVVTSYLEDDHKDDAIPLLDAQPSLSDLYRPPTPDFLPPLPDDSLRS
ncbi:hypothetical protein DFH29DRAFT_995960 [Suillus ampliporus]|nr:hypothetical protein DFH29DRAFT_995960 [Suillus ampliporus]